MSLIIARDICKSFDKPVLKNLDLTINKGEFVAIFGPNGCGKSTLLNVIAGVIKPDKGYIRVNGHLPESNKIGYVFQNYRDSLLPWKTNLENIAFPLELDGIGKDKRLALARKLVHNLNLNVPLNRYPYQSSGGEQQLVALLREVIAKPKIILMDEPFSALHHESRSFLRMQVQEIWRKLNLTILLVSHDASETIQLGDRVLLFSKKKINRSLHVDFARPRTEKLKFTDKFGAMLQSLKENEVQ